VAVVPFIEKSGISPLIEIQLSDDVKGIFLVDTGSNFSVVSDRIAKQLGIKLTPVVVHEAGAPFTEAVYVPHMKFGQWYHAAPFGVVRESDLEFNPGVHVDGILGTDLLSNYGVLFDFQKRRIMLWESGHPDNFTLGGLGLLSAPAFNLPKNVDNDTRITVPVKLNDRLVTDMLLDTGSYYCEVSGDVAQELGLPRIGTTEISTLGVKSSLDWYRLSTVAIGPVSISQTKVASKLDPQSFQPTSIVGLSVLSQFVVLFDYPASIVYMTRNSAAGTAAASGVNTRKTHSWSSVYAAGQEFETEKSYTTSITSPSGITTIGIQTDRLKYHVTAGDQTGTLLLSMKRTSSRYELDGKVDPPYPSANQDNVRTRTMSKRGEILKDSRADNAAPDIVFALIVGENTPAPDRPVAVGDTWTSQVAGRLSQGEKVTMTSTLVGEEGVSGHPTLRVHISVKLPVKDAQGKTFLIEGQYNIATDTLQILKREITIPTDFAATDGTNDGGAGTIVIKEHVVTTKKEVSPSKSAAK
jgi:hypothetical protein